MTTVTDTQLRTRMRSIVARYRLDLPRLTVRITRGTVRVSGELRRHGRPTERVALAVVEAFERDLTRTSGVQLVCFDLENWRRLGPGEWVPVEKSWRAKVCQGVGDEDEVERRAAEREAADKAAFEAAVEAALESLPTR